MAPLLFERARLEIGTDEFEWRAPYYTTPLAAAVAAFEEYDERKSQAVVWIGLSRLVRLAAGSWPGERPTVRPRWPVSRPERRVEQDADQREEAQRGASGPIGVPDGLPYARVNLPRSAFLNRESFPLALISRASAEYKVARGVLPAGDFQ